MCKLINYEEKRLREGETVLTLKVGDFMIFNNGSSSEVVKIEYTKSGKTAKVTTKYYTEQCEVIESKWVAGWKEQTRTLRCDTLILIKRAEVIDKVEQIQEVSIVETLKNETENIIQATKTQEPQEALQSIKNQLTKVTDTINNKIDINDESIRLPLRDIENNLKYNYTGLIGMMEVKELERDIEVEDSTVLDLTGVNFNNINELIPFISNWSKLPQNVQEAILKANNFYFFGSSLMLYIDSKGYAEAFITQMKNSKIDIDSIGFKNGLQWNEYQDDEPQESPLKITIDGEGSRKKVSYNNFKGADYEIALRCDQLEGYNKTWVTIELNNKIICNHVRIDLTVKDKLKGLKELLTTNAENSINYYKNYSIIKDEQKKLENIAELEKFIQIIKALDNEGNFKKQYNYSFWLKGAKVWEYTLDKLQEDKYTETTLDILSGEVKGYGSPVPNCKKEDIIVKIKELEIAV